MYAHYHSRVIYYIIDSDKLLSYDILLNIQLRKDLITQALEKRNICLHILKGG